MFGNFHSIEIEEIKIKKLSAIHSNPLSLARLLAYPIEGKMFNSNHEMILNLRLP